MRMPLCVCALFVFATTASAQSKLSTGTIELVNQNTGVLRVSLASSNGKSNPTRIVIDDDTRIVIDGKASSLKNLSPGDKITVAWNSTTEIATRIQVTSKASIDRDEKARQEQIARQIAEQQRAEKARQEQIARANAERQRLALEQAARAKAEQERLALQRQIEQARLARERQEAMDRERANAGFVKVTNNTDQEVTFRVTAINNSVGKSESRFHETLVKAKQSGYLSGDGIFTSRLEASVVNANGASNVWAWEKKNAGKDFEIEIHDAALLHVKTAELSFDSNTRYTTMKGRQPVITEHYKGYSISRGGEEYTYDKKSVDRYATAYTTIENPSRYELLVDVTVEFTFKKANLADLALGIAPKQVTTKMLLPARSKDKIFFEVDTKAITNAKEVASVRVVSIRNTIKD